MNISDLAIKLFKAYIDNKNSTTVPTTIGFQKLLDRGYDAEAMLEDANKYASGNLLASDLGDSEALNGVFPQKDPTEMFDPNPKKELFKGLFKRLFKRN